MSYKYRFSSQISTFALKSLSYADPKVVIFYLPQLFQALRVDSLNQIAHFMIERSEKSASIAHNILWFCKVESVREQGNGRKVELPVEEVLPLKADKLYEKIRSEEVMTHEQKEFFQTETDFFEKVTAISGLLKPSMSKDTKKMIIREQLI